MSKARGPGATPSSSDGPALSSPVFRKPMSKKPLIIALGVLILIALISMTWGRNKTRYEASVANRGKVIIPREVRVVEAAPPGWGAQASGPAKTEPPPQKAPTETKSVETAKSSAASPTPSPSESAPAAPTKAQKTDTKPPPAPAKTTKRVQVPRIIKRRPDGRAREVTVRSPEEAAEELNRIDRALKPGAPQRGKQK
ncbi:MAG: hypothetical protein FJ278_04180 [Planctomycetes bacterium]|nr:hypothetical protein [Planctomycetota bacterium]